MTQSSIPVTNTSLHIVAVKGTFDDSEVRSLFGCLGKPFIHDHQDTLKTLFADEDFNSTHHLASVNPINRARIRRSDGVLLHLQLQL